MPTRFIASARPEDLPQPAAQQIGQDREAGVVGSQPGFLQLPMAHQADAQRRKRHVVGKASHTVSKPMTALRQSRTTSAVAKTAGDHCQSRSNPRPRRRAHAAVAGRLPLGGAGLLCMVFRLQGYEDRRS